MEDSKIPVESFDDMAEKLKEGDDPAWYGETVMCRWDSIPRRFWNITGWMKKELDERGLISYGSNVKEVTTQISEGSCKLRSDLLYGCVFRGD